MHPCELTDTNCSMGVWHNTWCQICIRFLFCPGISLFTVFRKWILERSRLTNKNRGFKDSWILDRGWRWDHWCTSKESAEKWGLLVEKFLEKCKKLNIKMQQIDQHSVCLRTAERELQSELSLLQRAGWCFVLKTPNYVLAAHWSWARPGILQSVFVFEDFLKTCIQRMENLQ